MTACDIDLSKYVDYIKRGYVFVIYITNTLDPKTKANIAEIDLTDSKTYYDLKSFEKMEDEVERSQKRNNSNYVDLNTFNTNNKNPHLSVVLFNNKDKEIIKTKTVTYKELIENINKKEPIYNEFYYSSNNGNRSNSNNNSLRK